MGTQAKRIVLAEQMGTIKRIHVNQHKVRSGDPAITVQTSAGPLNASRIDITGTISFLHQPDSPLSCGAKLWIQTTDPIRGDWKD